MRWRPRPSTLGLAVIAAASIALVYADPWQEDDAGGRFVSTRSAAQRVFAELGEVGPEQARIALRRADGTTLELRPSDDGHALHLDDALLGPADPDALDGLWASLRMAVSLRAVADDAEVGTASTGTITVETSSGITELAIGGPTPDGVGVYGTVRRGDATEVFVIEREVAEILAQAPEAWLARRAVVVQPGQVLAIAFAGASLQRAEDGLWRSTVDAEGDSVTALLSTEAVEARLDRLLAARMDPLLEPDRVRTPATAWLQLGATADRSWTLSLRGECPGHPDRVVLDRGPGWLGCIDAGLVEPWPLPGRGSGALLEPRLSPYGYGQVLSIEQLAPRPSTIRREGGDWVLERSEQGTPTVQKLANAEVFRWYQRLFDAEVELVADAPGWSPDVDLRVGSDSTVSLRIRCGWAQGQRYCRRDDGPSLRMRDPDVPLSFDAETFAERQLLALQPGDAQAIEILPGPGGATPRQSAHLDLGVWRLDAPVHPDGDQALSEVALEELLAALGALRVEQWRSDAPGPAERIVVVQTGASRGQDANIEVRLHSECVVAVQGRFAKVGSGTCSALRTDLLHTDPLAFWLQTARSLEILAGETTVRLRRDGEAWLPDDGGPLDERWEAELRRWSDARVTALVAGRPSEPAGVSLRILPKRGPAFVVEVGPEAGWAAIADANWHYRLAPKPD